MSEDQGRYEVVNLPTRTEMDARKHDALPITSMAEIATAGQLLAQSGMFGISNAAAGFVVVATCQQQGISLMEFNRTYHIVQGKPTMRSDAMLAEFRKRGGKCKIIENNTETAKAAFTFEGDTYTMEYTIEDAKRTGDALSGDGKLKDMWRKRPDDMLWARLVSRSVRKLAPEIVSGIYTPEEVQDMRDTRPNNEPRRIDASEVKQRVAKKEAESLPDGWAIADSITIESDILEEANYCPIGGEEYEGVAWANMPDEILAFALESDAPEITEAHRDAVRSEIHARTEVV